MNITQVMEQYQIILNEEVRDMAWKTETIKRQGKLDAATLVQTMIFGFWQDPDLQVSGLAQIAQRREVKVTESAMSQRFTPECAELLKYTMGRLAKIHLEGEKVEIPLLKSFSAVVVEDSSIVTLPEKLSEIWEGGKMIKGVSNAAVKMFVRWDVLKGQLEGPHLEDGRTNDQKSPFKIETLPVGSLYLADLGFYDINKFIKIIGSKKERRYIVSRLQTKTNLYARTGHKIELKGILPQQVGEVREMGVLCGKGQKLVMRLIMVKVPDEVAEERKKKIYRTAQSHGHQPMKETVELAHWTLILTNIPRKRANYREILVLLRLRWQIERLFRLWKEDAKIDEWRSKKPYRILCEFYAKLCAMIIQQSLLQEGCWSDPYRSFVKAAAALRQECNRIMVAFYVGDLEKTVISLLRPLRSGCQLNHRKTNLSTAQLLLDGLDWSLELLA